ncbi:class I SAM-dependent methyltransferase [Candidatus Daviesbacteria bacterium]|nr:class I SAM-dependent methyltransferase [Candidatus Daviesbacteria bacterium]
MVVFLLGLILVFIFGISIPLIIITLFVYSLIGEWMDGPFVPTSQKESEKILRRARLVQGQLFLELGSGDGRLVRTAVKKYRVKGLGIEINPILVAYSKFISWCQGLEDAKFALGDFRKINLSQADVLYLFLTRRSLSKLSYRIIKETKKGSLIISHGFEVPGLQKFLSEKIIAKPFPTYFYFHT